MISMKFFIYKTLIFFFLAFVLFKLTIGSLIKDYEEKVDLYLSEENLIHIKIKAKEEMKNAIEKENYLNPEDAKLINKFLKKLQSEIFIQK
tara:strand:+ start:2329 stop:2601 length:273 start_codon:yes stop_codon:yes gene_type:complete